MSRHRFIVAVVWVNLVCLTVAAIIDLPDVFIPYGLFAGAYLAVGALVAWRKDTNPIGWLMLGAGCASIGLASLGLASVAEDSVTSGWLDAVGNSITTASVFFIPATLLRYPDGESLGGRWRMVEWLLTPVALLGVAVAVFNGGWGGSSAGTVAASTLREKTAPLGDILTAVFYPSMALLMVMSAVSLIVRYRQSSGEVRSQVKWLAFAGGLSLISSVSILVSGVGDADEPWQVALMVVALVAIPVAIASAVLRYRLYDIDLVINRTVVLAVLAGFITVVYALVVVGIGGLIGSPEGLLLPIVATAIVALSFEPVRHRAQRWANRLVFGRRASPYEVLSDLTRRLAYGEDGAGLLARMAQRLGDGTGAERASVWLQRGGAFELSASWPEDPRSGHTVDLAAPETFAVTHDGLVVGAFEVIKPRGTALSAAERSLIYDLAGSAGAVLGNQRLNGSLAAKAEELAQSRARLVEAQDRERRRLERELREGAQQMVIDLKAEIGRAAALAASHEASDLVRLFNDLSEDAQLALDEIIALAKGIYPPVLESDGLESAVATLASGVGKEVIVESRNVARYSREVEATIYFEISEALTNAVKHAFPPIRVDLIGTQSELRFSVADSGPGFDVTAANGGSGLPNLRDRIDAMGGVLRIVSENSGTTVSGAVPVGTTAR